MSNRIVFGVDIAPEGSEDASVIITAEQHEDGTITILDVQTWNEQVHPAHVPAGE